MAKWGDADFEQLKALKQKLEKLEGADIQHFCEMQCKDLAGRMLRLVIKRTPVGIYPADSGKKGGTLRRGWTKGDVSKDGYTYTIEIKNPVEYASYVEYGHRQTPGRFVPAIGKRLKASWVEGQYMMTKSEKDIENLIPGILERELEKFLKGVLGGDG